MLQPALMSYCSAVFLLWPQLYLSLYQLIQPRSLGSLSILDAKGGKAEIAWARIPMIPCVTDCVTLMCHADYGDCEAQILGILWLRGYQATSKCGQQCSHVSFYSGFTQCY